MTVVGIAADGSTAAVAGPVVCADHVRTQGGQPSDGGGVALDEGRAPGEHRRQAREVTVEDDHRSSAAGETLVAQGERHQARADALNAVPGPRARAHVAFDRRFTSPSLPRAYPLVPVRGEGSSVEDIDGNLLLDFTAGIAVSSTGYAHPRITAAIERQARELADDFGVAEKSSINRYLKIGCCFMGISLSPDKILNLIVTSVTTGMTVHDSCRTAFH